MNSFIERIESSRRIDHVNYVTLCQGPQGSEIGVKVTITSISISREIFERVFPWQ